MKKPNLISTIANAIGKKEGFFVTPAQWLAMGKKLPEGWKPGDPITLAQKNNNPGNLRSWGDYPKYKGYVKFPNPETGWAKLKRQVELNINRHLTFLQFFAGKRDKEGNVIPGGYSGFAPAQDGNDPVGYAEFVVSEVIKQEPNLLIDINTRIEALIDKQA